MCVHKNFEANVKVHRIYDNNSPNEDEFPDWFSAEIKIHCCDCYEQFIFIGLPMGLSNKEPRTSIVKEEVRMPIIPISQFEK